MKLPGDTIKTSSKEIKVKNNPKVKDVIESFKALPWKAQHIDCHTVGVFKGTEAYQGIKRRKIHYQGIIRTRDGNHLVLSGGDNKLRFPQIFILSLSSHIQNIPNRQISKRSKEAFGTNKLFGDVPLLDSLMEIKKFRKTDSWHAGGMDVCGDILAIPIEDSKRNTSKIKFINLSLLPNGNIEPEEISISNPINKRKSKAGACFLVRLPNKFYLCGVWSDSDDYEEEPNFKSETRKLDLYYSESTRFEDGFLQKVSWDYSQSSDKFLPKFQSIQAFIDQESNNLFLIGLENKSAGAPVIPGKNRAFLYKVEFNNDISSNSFRLKLPQISLIEMKEFAQSYAQYNFDGASGIYINADKKLAIYSCHHWNSESRFKIGEFYPTNPFSNEITSIHDSIIELYTKHDFGGRCLIIYGKRNSNIRDYSKILVQNYRFNVKVRSYKFRIPKGKEYILYSRIDHKRERLRMVGTGRLVGMNVDIGIINSSTY